MPTNKNGVRLNGALAQIFRNGFTSPDNSSVINFQITEANVTLTITNNVTIANAGLFEIKYLIFWTHII